MGHQGHRQHDLDQQHGQFQRGGQEQWRDHDQQVGGDQQVGNEQQYGQAQRGMYSCSISLQHAALNSVVRLCDSKVHDSKVRDSNTCCCMLVLSCHKDRKAMLMKQGFAFVVVMRIYMCVWATRHTAVA